LSFAFFSNEKTYFLYACVGRPRKILVFAEVAETAEESFASSTGNTTAFYVPEACCCGVLNHIPDLYQGAFLDY
jgi:hypothetical protein